MDQRIKCNYTQFVQRTIDKIKNNIEGYENNIQGIHLLFYHKLINKRIDIENKRVR